ncbi:MAG: DUF1176 domain-containing protein [Phenylobacterium sp.]|nr:DUF1176 domain-containing protein [Phenylobacterium sp.]
MRGGIGAIFGAAGLAVFGAAQAEDAGFGDWSVVCDNVRTCSAYGFTAQNEDPNAYLRLTRSGAPDAAPVITISAQGEGGATWRLEIDGFAVADGVQPRAEQDEMYQRATLTPAQAAAVLKGLANGGILSIWRGRDIVSAISLKGSSAALRWMDDRQKRGGTVTALVARGAKPASAVPALPEPPLVRPAAAPAQDRLPTTPPEALKYPYEGCDDDIESLGIGPQVFRLSPGVLLWQTACSRGAYNIIYDLNLTDERGGNIRPAEVVYPGGQRTSQLMNVEFEPTAQTLANFDKARGLGDCGAFTSWVWTGRDFALKSAEIMPDCRGVPLDDWATEFVSRP